MQPMAGSSGDAAGDRISDLPDDLLHHILGFLPDATAASRTAVLSRRWRRVWVHAHGLAFSATEAMCGAAPCRFAGFVDWVLAQRGDADIGSLQITTRPADCACASPPQRANEWIRYAMRHVVGSFVLVLPFGRETSDEPGTDPPIAELPRHGRATSIHMYLPHHRLHLPAAGAPANYAALTALRLDWVEFSEEAPGGGRRCTLGDFVSSCCPRLRKLELEFPDGLPQLVIRAGALEELHVNSADDMTLLDVTAPKLRVLNLQGCFYYDDDGKAARIVAPALEEIGIVFLPSTTPPELTIHGLASVRRLTRMYLQMHGRYYRRTDVGFWLLENCPAAEHVEASLQHCAAHHAATVPASQFVDRAPRPRHAASIANLNVKSMDLAADRFPCCHLVASVSSLLLRCPHLRSLRMEFFDTYGGICPRQCFPDGSEPSRSHKKICLYSLREVEISGIVGADEEMNLVSLLFKSSNSIKSVTLRTTTKMPYAVVSFKRMVSETIDQKLMKIAYTDRGRWNFGTTCTLGRAPAAEDTDVAVKPSTVSAGISGKGTINSPLRFGSFSDAKQIKNVKDEEATAASATEPRKLIFVGANFYKKPKPVIQIGSVQVAIDSV